MTASKTTLFPLTARILRMYLNACLEAIDDMLEPQAEILQTKRYEMLARMVNSKRLGPVRKAAMMFELLECTNELARVFADAWTNPAPEESPNFLNARHVLNSRDIQEKILRYHTEYILKMVAVGKSLDIRILKKSIQLAILSEGLHYFPYPQGPQALALFGKLFKEAPTPLDASRGLMVRWQRNENIESGTFMLTEMGKPCEAVKMVVVHLDQIMLYMVTQCAAEPYHLKVKEELRKALQIIGA